MFQVFLKIRKREFIGIHQFCLRATLGLFLCSFYLFSMAQDQNLLQWRFVKRPSVNLSASSYLPTTEFQISEEPLVRPFITDDARVVGKKLAQIESWLRIDRNEGQQWVMTAYGPNDRLEVSIGGVFGWDNESGKANFAYALPLIQAKYLIRPYQQAKGPGFGLVGGTFLPVGKGAFKPDGYGSFLFGTITQCFGKNEDLLLHLNTGVNYLRVAGNNQWVETWGFGTQARVKGGFHLVGEIFSGDPYVPGSGLSYQTGFRHFFSDLLQIDMTLGKGIAGDNILPLWYSAGVRIVLESFKN
jgi:hypothetical protein